MPVSTGMMAMKPLNSTEPKATVSRVVMEMMMAVVLYAPVASGMTPAMPVATPASSRPIRATMGPMVAGGSTTPIHSGPNFQMIRATAMKMQPEAMNPPSA